MKAREGLCLLLVFVIFIVIVNTIALPYLSQAGRGKFSRGISSASEAKPPSSEQRGHKTRPGPAREGNSDELRVRRQPVAVRAAAATAGQPIRRRCNAEFRRWRGAQCFWCGCGWCLRGWIPAGRLRRRGRRLRIRWPAKACVRFCVILPSIRLGRFWYVCPVTHLFQKAFG